MPLVAKIRARKNLLFVINKEFFSCLV